MDEKNLMKHCIEFVTEQSGGKWDDKAIRVDAAKLVAFVHSQSGPIIKALKEAEAALADIGDAERDVGDDLSWCEMRAASVLPLVRFVLDKVYIA